MHRHNQHLLGLAEIRRENLDRRLGIDHERRLRAKRADAPELDVQIAVRLDVHLYRLRARRDELLEIEVGTRQHEMHVAVEAWTSPAAEVDDGRTEAHVRHEVRIHYVDVYRVSAGRLGALQLVGKAAKVCREKRW